MRTRVSLALTLSLSLGFAAPASAGMFEVMVPILKVEGDQASFFQVGDVMTIAFETDDAVDDFDGTNGVGSFPGALDSLTLSFGMNDIVLSSGDSPANFYTTVDNAAIPDPPDLLDSVFLSVNAATSGDVDGIPLFALAIQLTTVGLGPELVESTHEKIGSDLTITEPTFVSITTFDVSNPLGPTSHLTLINFEVPEPGSTALLGAASPVALAMMRRRRR